MPYKTDAIIIDYDICRKPSPDTLADCREWRAQERAIQDETDFGLVYTADVLESMLNRLSKNGDCPEQDNKANEDILTDAEREGDTPATHAAPSQGSVQSECTLTDAEREAVEWRRKGIIVYSAGTVVATIATAVLSLSLLWFAK